MTSGIPVLFLVFLCYVTQLECGIICLSCTGLSEGEQCHNVVSCAQNEVCFTQKYRTKDNVTKYDVGCSYPELCRKDSTGVVFGKRMVDHGHVVCHQCCQDNVCNSIITCSDNYKAPRLSCLSCSGVTRIDKCNSTITCNDNEVCFIQKYRTGLYEHFDLGCKSSTICMNGFYSNIFGRRDEGERHLLCETCCGGNSFCNRNLVCNHYNQTSFNGSCTSTSGCKSNLVCLFGKCQCPTDYYWSTNSCTLRKQLPDDVYSLFVRCDGKSLSKVSGKEIRKLLKTNKLFVVVNAKGINHVCASSNECRKPLVCLNSCRCPIDKYWDGFNCNLRKMHNVHCNISAECSETLFCNYGICKCDRIDYWTGNNCTAKTNYGHSCLSNDACQSQLICADNKCTCRITEIWNGKTCITPPKECCDINFKVNGVYTIYPTDALHPKPVYCVIQNETRWTVIQRRFNGSVDFYRNWTSYKNGFGDVHGEYWLGNTYIHILSSNGRHKIRFQLSKSDGTNRYADYSSFSIGNEDNKYLLTVNGYSGTAGDSLINVASVGKAAGKRFSTFDSDNDPVSRNCAYEVHGGWWYSDCEYADLNKRYSSMYWVYGMGPVNKSTMMISRDTCNTLT